MRKGRTFLIGVFLVLGLFLINQKLVYARMPHGFDSSITPLFPTSRIIMIYGTEEGRQVSTQLEPEKLWIDRFTEVTWINVSQSDVRIKFGEGKKCEEVATAVFPGLGLRLNPQKCVVTRNSIPPKGTLRFFFKEPGDYRYEVQYVDKNLEVHGDIRVY